MRPSNTHPSKEMIEATIKKVVTEAEIKIKNEISKQVDLWKIKLHSEGLSLEEIEKILNETAEKQYQISMIEFHRRLLQEKRALFTLRSILK